MNLEQIKPSFEETDDKNENLGDSKDDLFILDVELTKINGLLKVLLRKSEEFSNKNPDFSKGNATLATKQNWWSRERKSMTNL